MFSLIDFFFSYASRLNAICETSLNQLIVLLSVPNDRATFGPCKVNPDKAFWSSPSSVSLSFAASSPNMAAAMMQSPSSSFYHNQQHHHQSQQLVISPSTTNTNTTTTTGTVDLHASDVNIEPPPLSFMPTHSSALGYIPRPPTSPPPPPPSTSSYPSATNSTTTTINKGSLSNGDGGDGDAFAQQRIRRLEFCYQIQQMGIGYELFGARMSYRFLFNFIYVIGGVVVFILAQSSIFK
eukprot:TRINITY_DN18750_c0_g1_i2.p1 TRINITY_DN18750_c0_g1~~TRINITY_DN18750_c0_g1_i2.p1  ORF type:complete len:238 (-),score=62.40 TRINITY_DN18750_c0_g1_i2:84-797(-)